MLLLLACLTPVSTQEAAPEDTALPPSHTGEASTSKTVTVAWDSAGVPHVIAATDAGALYGAGWASAKDRHLQMNLYLLGEQGRLAEFFGADHIEADTNARVTQRWAHAQRTAANLDADTLALLQAYADGVNAWTAAGDLDPRFKDHGLTPMTWTPAHCIAAWNHLAGGYTGNAQAEASRYAELQADIAELGEEAAIEAWLSLFHPGQSEAAVVQEEEVDAETVQAIARYAASLGHVGGGLRFTADSPAPHFSHAFAISGDRSESGEPMIVADPQLEVTNPAIWHEIFVYGETLHARGVTVPGTPGMAVGRTPGVAWGITAGGGDQSDLFRLEMKDSDTYTIDGVDHDLTRTEETLLVAGGDPVQIEVVLSRWGPVVTSLLDDPDGEFALVTLADLEPERDTVQGMLGMMRAQDLGELVDSLDDWRSPVVNLVAAEAKGSIYYSLIGGIPVRSLDAELGGYVAQDGATAQAAWQDVIPHTYLPQVWDPAKGSVYSANHRAVGDWYPLPLNVPQNTGGHSDRSRRLRALLDQGEVLSAEALLAVQNDCVDQNRLDLVRVGLHALEVAPSAFDSDAARALLVLEDWDGDMSRQVPEAWLARHMPGYFRGEAGELGALYYGGAAGTGYFLDTQLSAIDADPDYVPDAAHLAYLNAVFAAAVAGVDGAPYTEWAGLQAAANDVSLSTYSPLIGVALDTQEATAVSLNCTWVPTVHAQKTQSFTQFTDFGGDSLSLMPPGNSERADHPGYLAERDNWEKGTLKAAPISLSEVRALAVDIETLSYTP